MVARPRSPRRRSAAAAAQGADAVSEVMRSRATDALARVQEVEERRPDPSRAPSGRAVDSTLIDLGAGRREERAAQRAGPQRAEVDDAGAPDRARRGAAAPSTRRATTGGRRGIRARPAGRRPAGRAAGPGPRTARRPRAAACAVDRRPRIGRPAALDQRGDELDVVGPGQGQRHPPVGRAHEAGGAPAAHVAAPARARRARPARPAARAVSSSSRPAARPGRRRSAQPRDHEPAGGPSGGPSRPAGQRHRARRRPGAHRAGVVVGHSATMIADADPGGAARVVARRRSAASQPHGPWAEPGTSRPRRGRPRRARRHRRRCLALHGRVAGRGPRPDRAGRARTPPGRRRVRPRAAASVTRPRARSSATVTANPDRIGGVRRRCSAVRRPARSTTGSLAESAVYSALQAGPEFAAWRAAGRSAATTRASGPPVAVRRDGDELHVTLPRPEVRNALDRADAGRAGRGLRLVRADPSITRVHLRGRRPVVLRRRRPRRVRVLPRSGHRPPRPRCSRAPAGRSPRSADRVTAHLHGACFGSGIELPAFAAEVVADRSTVIALPEVVAGPRARAPAARSASRGASAATAPRGSA